MPRPPLHPEAPSLLHSRFTDREAFRDRVEECLSTVTGPLPALMFYGVGGIGKSWLLRHLYSSVKDKIPSVLIDFTLETGGNPFRLDPIAILEKLREITIEPCPQFDIALALSLVRRNRLDENTLRDKVKSGSISTVWEVLKGTVGLAHPVAALTLGVLEKGYGFIRDRALLRRIEEIFLKDLEELKTKELSEIERDLVRRLGEDCKRPSKPIFPRTAKSDALKAWMKNRSEVHGGAGKRPLRW